MDSYHNVMWEIVPDKEYSENQPIVYLYVKDIGWGKGTGFYDDKYDNWAGNSSLFDLWHVLYITRDREEGFQKIKKWSFESGEDRKTIAREKYLERIKALKDTPDIKIITGIRRSG